MVAKTYLGKVCRKHPELKGERYASNHCPGCHRKNATSWAVANREKKYAINRKWTSANREAKRAINRKWADANPEQARESARKWKAANPAICSAKEARRRVLKANAAVPLTWLDKLRIQELYEIAQARSM